MQGRVKWFSNEKGYGFITSDDGTDHYFNVKSVNGSELPREGDIVKFDSKQGNKGFRAEDVSIEVRKTSSQKFQKADDRIQCPKCNKKIVPRLVTYRGSADRSLCPYCGALVKDFNGSSLWLVALIVVLVIGALISEL